MKALSLFIYYTSYLSLPLLILLIFFLSTKRKTLHKTAFLLGISTLLCLTLLFVYARFIERYIILEETTSIQTGIQAKIAVISDIHVGIFKDETFLERVVERINAMEGIDAVVIPGDLTYYPNKSLDTLLRPLEKLNIPTYAILGNHDSEKPGPPVRNDIQKALKKHNVTFLHNSHALIPYTDIVILGLGDAWANEDDIAQIDQFTPEDKLIALTHNPDVAMKYTSPVPDLTISGHTHGGQIRIPYLYKFVIPSEHGFDKGLYTLKNGKVFVSTGLGEVGLPMRLGIPPRIDVLELY